MSAAATVRARARDILAANERDVAEARQRGTVPAFVDRLVLDEGRIEGVARGLDAIAALPDPIGRVLDTFKRPQRSPNRAGSPYRSASSASSTRAGRR